MGEPRVCFVFGSGASRGAGYNFTDEAIQRLKNIGITMLDKKIPLDMDFWKCIEIEKEKYPALWLLRSKKPKIISMEATWSMVDLIRQEGIFGIAEDEMLDYIKKAKNSGNDWGFESIEDFYGFFREIEYEYCRLEERKQVHEPSLFGMGKIFRAEFDTEYRDLLHQIYDLNNFNIDPFHNNYSKLFTWIKTYGIEFDIITFNYDLFAEKNLDKYCYISENGRINKEKKVPAIVKMHGSLNWLEQSRENPIIFCEKEIEGNISEGRSAIVPPTFNKPEITGERPWPQSENPAIHHIIDAQWKYAENLLKLAEKWIFVGYRFPSTDQHAHKLLIPPTVVKIHPKKAVYYCLKGTDDKDTILDLLKNKAKIDPDKMFWEFDGFEESVNKLDELLSNGFINS